MENASKSCELPISDQLNNNINTIRDIYSDCYDFVLRPIKAMGYLDVCLIYLSGISNTEAMNEHVLTPLMTRTEVPIEFSKVDLSQYLHVSETKELFTMVQVAESISNGNPVLFLDTYSVAISMSLADFEKRPIQEPESEPVIRGPREGFTEVLETNTSMLRRRIKSPDFKLKAMTIGKYSETKVIVAYVKGLASEGLIKEVISRLEKINIDGIVASYSIMELIQDNKYSLFPQFLETERPDNVAANLLEGRVCILTENTPVQIIVPTTFFTLLSSPEDYYLNWVFSSLIRLLRLLAIIISLLLPSTYIAILSYHQQMLPTALMISIASSREQVPFPPLVEVLIMEFMFELLREAGVRLPKQFGSSVSIVGALVIGESAVSAGLISAPMIMIVALTGISNFAVPHYNFSIPFRVLRFVIMLLSGFLGMLGIVYCIIYLLTHLCALRSFGVTYFSPFDTHQIQQWKDMLLRAPLWKMKTRPHLTGEELNRNKQPNTKEQKNKLTDDEV